MKKNKKRGIKLRDDDGISFDDAEYEWQQARPAEHWEEHKVHLQWGRPVTKIDDEVIVFDDHCVFEDGTIIGPEGRLRWQNRDGYAFVSLKHKERGCCSAEVHRLVCWMFHGPPPFDGALVRHLDGYRDNNHFDNLCWGDELANARDRMRHIEENEQFQDFRELRANAHDAMIDQMNQRSIAYKFIDDRYHPLMWVCHAGRLGAAMINPMSECHDVVKVLYGNFDFFRRDTVSMFGLNEGAPGIEWLFFNITRWELAHAGQWLAEQAHHLFGGPPAASPFFFDDDHWSIDCVRLGLKKRVKWLKTQPSDVIAAIDQPRGGEVSVRLSLVSKERSEHG